MRLYAAKNQPNVAYAFASNYRRTIRHQDAHRIRGDNTSHTSNASLGYYPTAYTLFTGLSAVKLAKFVSFASNFPHTTIFRPMRNATCSVFRRYIYRHSRHLAQMTLLPALPAKNGENYPDRVDQHSHLYGYRGSKQFTIVPASRLRMPLFVALNAAYRNQCSFRLLAKSGVTRRSTCHMRTQYRLILLKTSISLHSCNCRFLGPRGKTRAVFGHSRSSST